MKNTYYNIKKENKESKISDTLKFTEKFKEILEESTTIVKEVIYCENIGHVYSKLLQFMLR